MERECVCRRGGREWVEKKRKKKEKKRKVNNKKRAPRETTEIDR